MTLATDSTTIDTTETPEATAKPPKAPQTYTVPGIATVYTRLFPDKFEDTRWNKTVKAFVTQILGTDPQYGFRRIFPMPVKIETDGTRVYALMPGSVYQINRVLRRIDDITGEPYGDKFAISRFYQVAYDFEEGTGHLVELDRQTADHLALSMDAVRTAKQAKAAKPKAEKPSAPSDTVADNMDSDSIPF